MTEAVSCKASWFRRHQSRLARLASDACFFALGAAYISNAVGWLVAALGFLILSSALGAF